MKFLYEILVAGEFVLLLSQCAYYIEKQVKSQDNKPENDKKS